MKQVLSLITILLLTASVSFAQEKKLGEDEPFVPTAEELAKYLPELKAGDAAPALAAPDTLGNIVSLDGYRGSYVIIDFWATWCGPCMMLGPVIAEIAEERKDVIKVGKVNVDEEPELAAKFGIMSIPTLVVIKNGQIVTQSAGVQPKESILAMID